MESFDIYHDLPIKATAAKTFEGISNPEHLKNWWPLRCSGKPEKGAVYNFYFGPEYNWFAEVVSCRPDSAFHLSMTKSDADWDPTSFGFDIQRKEEGILLKFRHTGWPERNAHFRRSSFCWAMLLNGLKNYLEKGIIIPFEERE
ncbi:SRPBCC family protein [Pareuzebyella sediminis]|uniref:SRPBCC family protein n=1 Tax=Pareuzebyella sediminis TaxID=2607998 RepID=UPI0011EBF851|nr:SRPBCC domain-containing protein [Pareuzebyella sediminis]